jgi:hypothetical protein
VSSKISSVQATKKCFQYLRDIHGLKLIQPDIQDIQLEEIASDDNFWFVTLGYRIPIDSQNETLSSESTTPGQYKRIYKIFHVNKTTGEVEAMKNCQL